MEKRAVIEVGITPPSQFNDKASDVNALSEHTTKSAQDEAMKGCQPLTICKKTMFPLPELKR
jgi:hypothetical protein